MYYKTRTGLLWGIFSRHSALSQKLDEEDDDELSGLWYGMYNYKTCQCLTKQELDYYETCQWISKKEVELNSIRHILTDRSVVARLGVGRLEALQVVGQWLTTAHGVGAICVWEMPFDSPSWEEFSCKIYHICLSYWYTISCFYLSYI